MGAHCITDYRAIKTVQNCSEIQLTVCTFDFCHIADVLCSGRRCGKIPPHQNHFVMRENWSLSGYADAFCVLTGDFPCITDNTSHSLDAVLPAMLPVNCAPRSRDAVVVIVSGPIPFPHHDLYALVCVSNHNTLPGVHREPDSTMQYYCPDDWLRSMHIADADGYRLSTRHKTQRFPKNVVCFVQFLQLAC